MVGVEACELGRDVVAAAVGLGDHHHDRVRQRPAGEHEQLEHVVEGRRVRAAGTDDRQDLREVVAEQLRRQLRLARPHPVDVAPQRVDLAVVGDHPVGVGELPARERVRRVARVHERERGGSALVAEIRVVGGQLRRRQHPLVDHRAGREARDHEVRAGRELRDAADHVQLALERVEVERRAPPRRRAAGRAEPSRPLPALPGSPRRGRRATQRPAAPRPRPSRSEAARALWRVRRRAGGSTPPRRTTRAAAAPGRLRRGRARPAAAASCPRRRPCRRRRPRRRGARGWRAPSPRARASRGSRRRRAVRRRRRRTRRARTPGRRGRRVSQPALLRCPSRLCCVRLTGEARGLLAG